MEDIKRLLSKSYYNIFHNNIESDFQEWLFNSLGTMLEYKERGEERPYRLYQIFYDALRNVYPFIGKCYKGICCDKDSVYNPNGLVSLSSNKDVASNFSMTNDNVYTLIECNVTGFNFSDFLSDICEMNEMFMEAYENYIGEDEIIAYIDDYKILNDSTSLNDLYADTKSLLSKLYVSEKEERRKILYCLYKSGALDEISETLVPYLCEVISMNNTSCVIRRFKGDICVNNVLACYCVNDILRYYDVKDLLDEDLCFCITEYPNVSTMKMF